MLRRGDSSPWMLFTGSSTRAAVNVAINQLAAMRVKTDSSPLRRSRRSLTYTRSSKGVIYVSPQHPTVPRITSIPLCRGRRGWVRGSTSLLSHFLRAFYKESAIKSAAGEGADVTFLFLYFCTFVTVRKKRRRLSSPLRAASTRCGKIEQ